MNGFPTRKRNYLTIFRNYYLGKFPLQARLIQAARISLKKYAKLNVLKIIYSHN